MINYLADDNGNELLDLAGDDFYVAESADLRGPRPGEMTIKEMLSLVGLHSRSSGRFYVADLERVLEIAARYVRTPRPDELVWWYAGTTGELARRALVHSGLVTVPAHGRVRNWMMLTNEAVELLLEINRGAWWESSTPDTIATAGTNYTIGTTLEITPGGSGPGRVDSLRVACLDAGPKTRLWAGFREMGAGVDDFEAVWDLYDGSIFGGAYGATSRIADSNGWNGHTVQAAHSSLNSRNLRIQISLEDIVGLGDARHMIGRYLLLLRWSGSSGSEFAITAAQRVADFVAFEPLFHERVYVTGAGTSTYDLLPLAVVDIPSVAGGRGKWTSAQLKQSIVELYTEMVAGTVGDTLRLNTITAIPVGRSLRATRLYTEAAGYQGQISCLPSDIWTGWNVSLSGFPGEGIDVSASNFYAPHEGGVLVAAMARSDSHVHNDRMSVSLDLVRRWRTYRVNDAERLT